MQSRKGRAPKDAKGGFPTGGFEQGSAVGIARGLNPSSHMQSLGLQAEECKPLLWDVSVPDQGLGDASWQGESPELTVPQGKSWFPGLPQAPAGLLPVLAAGRLSPAELSSTWRRDATVQCRFSGVQRPWRGGGGSLRFALRRGHKAMKIPQIDICQPDWPEQTPFVSTLPRTCPKHTWLRRSATPISRRTLGDFLPISVLRSPFTGG